MFVEIDDTNKAWELYQAGLLWEGHACNREPPRVAYGWDDRAHTERGWHDGSRGEGATGYVFYIQIEA